jgi:hypothetical protein
MTNNTEQRRAFEDWWLEQKDSTFSHPKWLALAAWQAALAQRENTDKPLEQVWDYKPKLHAASYQHNGIDYAITLEGCNEEVHAHAMRLGMAIDGNIVHQEMLSAAPAPSLYDIPDNELPGMWEKADFEGGKPDVVRGPAPSLCTAEEAAELAWNAAGWYVVLSDADQLAAIINADRAKR